MRISDSTFAILTSLSQKHFGEYAQLRLFGSRVNDNARGGDIDIHVIAPGATFRDEVAFLTDVNAHLDERVDLRVQRTDKLLIDDIALERGVVLRG